MVRKGRGGPPPKDLMIRLNEVASESMLDLQ